MSVLRCGDNNPNTLKYALSTYPLGLTLIELVVVLAILAALAGVAVRSLEPIADQARYETSQKQLTQIGGVLIEQTNTGASVGYAGFVCDVGRLPIARGADPATQAGELLFAGAALHPFAIMPFDDPNTTDNEASRSGNVILIAAGWRGPYLQMPPGSNAIRDGYGQPLSLFNAAGFLASDGDEIVDLVSRGANDLLHPADVGYQRDLHLPGGPMIATRYRGDLPVRVTDVGGSSPPKLASGETLIVRVYGPGVDENEIGGTPTTLATHSWSVSSDAGYAEVFRGLVSGPKVVRAMIVTGSTPNEQIVLGRESLVRQIQIRPGMNTEILLRLP